MNHQKISEHVPADALACWHLMRPHLERLSSLAGNFPEGLSSRIAKASEALERLPLVFSDTPDTKKLWAAATTNGPYSGWQLCHAICLAFMGSDVTEDGLKKTARNKWQEDVQANAGKLYNLIVNTRYNSIGDERAYQLCNKVLAAIEDELGECSEGLKGRIRSVFFESCTGFHWMLHDLQEKEPKDIRDWLALELGIEDLSITLKKPGDSEASRAYFVRYMTVFFLRHCGRPERGKVASLVSHLYGIIDPKSLVELTKDLTQGE